MFKKTKTALLVSVSLATSLIACGCAAVSGESGAASGGSAKTKADYTSMTPEALAEYLIFESKSYKLDQPTQEGTTGKARLVQDDTMKACSKTKGGTPDADTLKKIQERARASIKYPEGGIKLGDWKKGRELAWSGFGYRTAHNPDDHSKGEPGANCYNCHQLATDRTGGSIGPSLTGYGKTRGNSEAMLKYTYEVIYNPHAYFPCTQMPRMGANKVLTEQQIADVMAYLFDPASPVNK